MKTKSSLPVLLIASALALGFASCNNSAIDPEFAPNLKSATFGAITDYPDLVSDEQTGILQMREEEKMAHDIYITFSGLFNESIFGNIAASETNHYEAVGNLIKAYQLTDPSTGTEGTFTNPEISELYASLIATGSGTLLDALKTGALIEETDIIDLEKLVAATENPLILQVYNNLLSGSRNHLRSFVATLTIYGETYVPQLMDQEAFDTIINAPMETQKQNGTRTGNGKDKTGSASSGKANSSSRNQNGTGTGICINS